MAYGNVNAPGVTPSEVASEIARELEGYLPASETEKQMSYKVGLGVREQIPENGDLNDAKYLAHRSFGVMGTATAKTIKNCPTAVAFMLDNFTCGGNDTAPNGANDYTFQRLIDINGNIWGRNSFTNGSGTRSFGEWKTIPVTGQYIPASQKGAANGVASLDANGDVPFAQMGPYLLKSDNQTILRANKWNDIPAGIYPVDISGYLDGSTPLDENAPVGLYPYGLLLSYTGRNTKVQLYFTHKDGCIAIREYWGSWNSWRYFPVFGASSTIATAPNNTSYTTKQVRNITLSTAAASGGGNGDLFFTYI